MTGPRSAALALVTEHFVLQSARGAMIGEMVGRGSICLGTVSGALIAFGFIAQSELRLAPFVAAVLPAPFVLGELTFVALLRDSFQNIEFLRRIQEIRGYYRDSFRRPKSSSNRLAGTGRRTRSGLTRLRSRRSACSPPCCWLLRT